MAIESLASTVDGPADAPVLLLSSSLGTTRDTWRPQLELLRPAITAPALVIAGAQDPATPIEHARVLVAGIPGARLLTIEGTAHLASVEQPAAVGEAIVHHLRGTA